MYIKMIAFCSLDGRWIEYLPSWHYSCGIRNSELVTKLKFFVLLTIIKFEINLEVCFNRFHFQLKQFVRKTTVLIIK